MRCSDLYFVSTRPGSFLPLISDQQWDSGQRQVPVQLLILIILISTFTSSILCYTLTLDMGTSNAIAEMLYEWGSICGYGGT